MNRNIVTFFGLCVFAMSTLVNADTVPRLINYQGKLVDAAGNPLTNGSYELVFRIWNKPNSGDPGHQLIWGQTQQVTAVKGVFNVILGAPGENVVPGAAVNDIGFAFNDAERYLGITITRGADGVPIPNPQEILPRQQILSAPYALRAGFSDRAEQARNSDTVASIGASATPMPNTLLPLDSSAKLPPSVLSLRGYDSGWFPASPNTLYTKDHNLGTTKCLVVCFVSDNADGSGHQSLMQNWWWDPNGTDFKSVICSLTGTQVKIRTSPSGIGQFMDENGNGVSIRTGGALRIVMLALE